MQIKLERRSLIDVETIRLDNTISATESVSFIKIDVEGRELDVLQGAQKLLTTQMPMISELLSTDIEATARPHSISGRNWVYEIL